MFKTKHIRLTLAVGICSMAIGSVTFAVLLMLASAVQVRPLTKVIIDTDAGIDDAVALTFAITDPAAEVLAITCVRGNTDIDSTVTNVFRVLEVTDRKDIPVYAGNDYELMTKLPKADYFGKDGLGDIYDQAVPNVNIQKEHAAVHLAKIVAEKPGEIILICLGPLTNLALAISLQPHFFSLVKRVIILGGTIRGEGNQSPGVEFNFYRDPDAASLVLQRASMSSRTVTVMPLEPLKDARISLNWRWDTLAKINNKIMKFLNEIEKADLKMHPKMNTYKPYDSSAVAVALVPDFVISSERLFAEIDPFGQSARGAVLIDYNNVTGKTANVDFIMKINNSVFEKQLYNNFRYKH